MKIFLKKVAGTFGEERNIGVHLLGAIQDTACGLDLDDYKTTSTNKPITCSTCLDYLSWSKKAAKIKA